jgi:hypothetical protein
MASGLPAESGHRHGQPNALPKARDNCPDMAFLLESGAGATPVELRMRRSQTILRSANQDTYSVLDDFGGNLGRVWRETAEGDGQPRNAYPRPYGRSV